MFRTTHRKMLEGAFCNITSDRMEHTPQFLDLNVKLNYTFVLHDHIKLQLNTGVQNIFNSFQKDLDKGEFRDAGYFYGPTQREPSLSVSR